MNCHTLPSFQNCGPNFNSNEQCHLIFASIKDYHDIVLHWFYRWKRSYHYFNFHLCENPCCHGPLSLSAPPIEGRNTVTRCFLPRVKVRQSQGALRRHSEYLRAGRLGYPKQGQGLQCVCCLSVGLCFFHVEDFLLSEQSLNACCVPSMTALSIFSAFVSQHGFAVHKVLSAEGKTRTGPK